MAKSEKYDLILDALQNLLEKETIQAVTVSEIAETAGIGKGSIYYYFPSKNAILEALIERNYKEPLETAKNLAARKDVSPFTRMALIFQACRASKSYMNRQDAAQSQLDEKEDAYLHHRYMSYLIAELKPTLAEIIRQGIASGEIHFPYPDALAEIVLIVLTVKLDNTLVSSTREELEETIEGLITLLEKGTENPEGSLNFLKI